MRSLSAATLVVLLATLAWMPASARAQERPLTDAEAREASGLIASMRANPRGPYSRILWYCADGTQQPPRAGACTPHGGGVQHAEYSRDRRRLAELGMHVGTILQADSLSDFLDPSDLAYRLQELVLERYLFEVDDGWVLHRARFYRGARQVEDEDARGRALLEALLADTAWTARNFLLASRLVAVVPHAAGAGERRTAQIRNLAAEIAERDESFQPLRVKIHSVPTRVDLDSVEARLARAPQGETREMLARLRDLLAARYAPGSLAEELELHRAHVGAPYAGAIDAAVADLEGGRDRAAMARLAELAAGIREGVTSSADGPANVELMNLGLAVQDAAFTLASEQGEEAEARPRSERLEEIAEFADLAYGAGFLSGRERAALRDAAERLASRAATTAGEYRSTLRYLSRGLDWSYAGARAAFAPVVDHWSRAEPKASGFYDALIRGSVALAAAQRLDVLVRDSDRLLATPHLLFGEEITAGIRGMNPGLAVAPLAIATGSSEDLEPDRIYALAATTAELRPVAGILTLDAGNLLSHVQLLARNLGVPNAAVGSARLGALQAAEGDSVFYAVSPLGRVVLERLRDLPAEFRGLVREPARSEPARYRLDASRLRLDANRPIPLSELRANDSGVRVGPKAANLGQLASYFPAHVSPGVALPFGLFHEHVDRSFEGGPPPLDRLRRAYRHADSLRAAGATEAAVDSFMFGELAAVRRAILELPWQPDVLREIDAAIETTTGGDPSVGVFVRSDTNVEDLPQFSGAGLNLTLPNRVGRDSVLSGIRRVWTSPFSERSYLWRKRVLEEQGDIYPSVLLLRSVPSDKSGVLITSGLQEGSPDDLTIAVAEGVGGAVEGEQAEEILVAPDGRVTLLSQARALERRVLLPSGEAAMVPARRPEVLLQPDEIAQLRDVVRQWKRKFAPGDPDAVWDMEFGFVDGKLWLFQIRPFVRIRNTGLLEKLEQLDAGARAGEGRRVDLREAV